MASTSPLADIKQAINRSGLLPLHPSALCTEPTVRSVDRTMIQEANMAPVLQKGCRWSGTALQFPTGSEARLPRFESCLCHYLCSFELAASPYV